MVAVVILLLAAAHQESSFGCANFRTRLEIMWARTQLGADSASRLTENKLKLRATF